MYIKLSYDQEFDDLYMYLRSKYPQELFDLDGIGKQLDMHQFAKEFYGISGAAADVSIDANANVVGRDVITYTFEMPKAFHKLNSYYLLWRGLRKAYGLDYANKTIEKQLTGDIYINDAWDIGRPYCFNFSTYDIALHGLPMGDRVKPVPPKSLYSFVRQVEQFTVYAANSTLGATGLADLFIVMAWYVDRMYATFLANGGVTFKDNKIELWDDRSYVKEVIASLVYTLNWQFRGNQSPFTNVSLYDDGFLQELVPHYLIDGAAPRIETVKRLQAVYLDIMNEELTRAPLTFPVTTACFSVDESGEIQDQEFLKLISEKDAPFGFINIYCGKTSTLSSCCRLRSDKETLGYTNSFGAGSTKIGSLGVVTINLPRLAAKAVEKFALFPESIMESFLDALEHEAHNCQAINEVKRYIVRRRVERGNLPLYTLGHMDLNRQYSTIGVTGLYEAVSALGYDILTEQGQVVAEEIIKTINNVNKEWSELTGTPFNVEQVPGESSAVKLCEKDALMGYQTHGTTFYSNQFLPLTVNASMLDRIKLQGKFDSMFSGGAIMHLNVDEQMPAERIADLIRLCAKKGVVYWAINYALGRCANGHVGVQAQDMRCPACGAEITDTYTRVVGFLTNTKNWNKVRRKDDWPNREFYHADTVDAVQPETPGVGGVSGGL